VFDALVVAASENQPWPVAQDLRTGAGGGEADAVNGTVFGLFLAQGENFTARGNTFVGYKYPVWLYKLSSVDQ
jgi:hypothetical protein